MMQLKERILDTADYRYLKREEDPIDNLRNAYEVALELDGKHIGFLEEPDEMFRRVGKFCWTYEATLNEIACDVYDDLGLAGGATGSASIADIKDIPKEAALKLFDITFARHEAGLFKQDVTQQLMAWAARGTQDRIRLYEAVRKHKGGNDAC